MRQAAGEQVASVVDAYIAKHPVEVQPLLERVRGIIRRTLPEAEETISYQIPAYKLHGQYVVYFAGWKRHWSLYPVTDPVRAALGPALASYEVRKGTVRFRLDEAVPERLVARIVKRLAGAADARRPERPRRERRVGRGVRTRRRT